MGVSENKSSYFKLDIRIPKEFLNSQTTSDFDNTLDMVLYSMNASDKDIYKIIKNDNSHIIIIFKALTRKRNGQLNKFCERYIDSKLTYNTKALSKLDVIETLKNAETNHNYSTIRNRIVEVYNGQDIQIFKDRKNWHSWQKDVYDMIYGNNHEILTPHPRRIISLVDYDGNSGKSSFFKFIYTQDKNDNIGRATYGTASQLRSALINQGPKKIYIIDLARARAENDRITDVISVLEDLKTGFIISPMYGKSQELLIEPPHVLLSSNFLVDTTLLSPDRWEIYEIKNNKLGKKNQLLKQNKTKNFIKK